MKVIEVQIGGRAFTDVGRAYAHLVEDLETRLEKSAPRVSRVLLRYLHRVATELEKRHSTPWNGSVAHSRPDLFRRSGEGLNSIRRSIMVRGRTLSRLEGRISAGLLSVHETGAVIRARNARFLTIPLPAAMDSRGVPLRRRARDWDNTFVQRSRNGNLLIFQRQPGGIIPLYLLKPEVEIRPRLGMGNTLEGELGFFETRALDAIERALSRRQ